jgi:NAD-dependent DNA ligase
MNKVNKIDNADIIDFLNTQKEENIQKILEKANDSYHNTDSPFISDTKYDLIYEYFKEKYPKNSFLNKVGSKTTEPVALPYWLGSMDKIKSTKEISKWLKSNTGDTFVVTDKLDGASALYYQNKLFTRGDGSKGKDISFLLKYLNLPQVDFGVRGELVINKKLFPNARNIVVGVLNSKKKSIDEIAPNIKFITYEIIHNSDTQPSQSQQLSLLKASGFFIAPFDTYIRNDINEKKLSSILFERKALSDFDIDGLIITNDKPYNRNIKGNPSYAIAFKINTTEYETTVTSVEWNVSKDGYIIPTVKFNTIDINGIKVSSAQGFNAKYILDNKIGVDSVIAVVRSGDVIPYIVRVIKSSEPNLPTMAYIWNKNKVHFVLQENQESLTNTRVFTHFLKSIGVKHFDEKIVQKLSENGIDSITKIANITVDDLLKIDGFQKTLAEKFVQQIQKCIENVDLITLMVASNSWGHGFSFKKLKLVLDQYPNIMNESPTYEQIISIPGYSKITSEQFLTGLSNFKNFLKINKLKYVEYVKNELTGNKYEGKTFVFSGFRDKILEKNIIDNGGKVSSTLSKNTHYLVVKDLNSTSSKVEKAKELGVEIITNIEVN